MTKKSKKKSTQPRETRGSERTKASRGRPDSSRISPFERALKRLGGRKWPVGVFFGLIVGGSFLLSLVCIWQYRGTPFFRHPVVDEEVFVDWALRIFEGEWIGREVFYFDPLYPYTLAILFHLFGQSLLIVRVFQAALGAGSVALVFLSARKLAGERIALLASLFLALYGPRYFFELLILKESMVIFLSAAATALGIYAADQPGRWKRWPLLGVVLALITLLRGNFLALLPLAVLGAFLVNGKGPFRPRLIRALLMAGGMSMVILPVSLRNYLVGGEVVITTSQAGANFYIGNNERANGRYAKLDFVRPNPWFEAKDFKAEAEKRLKRELSPNEVSRFWFREAFRWIRAEPGRAFWLTLHKARLLIHNYELEDNNSFRVMREEFVPALWVAFLGFGLLWGPAVVGLYQTLRHDRRAWLPALIAAVYPLSIIPFFIVDRYRLAVVPELTVFAALGFAAIYKFLRDKQMKRFLIAAGAMIAAWGLSLTSIPETREPRGLDYLEIAMAYHYSVDGDLDEAQRWYERAWATLPVTNVSGREMIQTQRQLLGQTKAILAEAQNSENAEQIVQLGGELEQLRQFRLATELYQKALTLSPDLVKPRARLGIIHCDLFEFRDCEQGLAYLFPLLKPETPDPQVMGAIANCYLKKGDKEKAGEWLEKILAVVPGHQNAAEQLELLRNPWR